MEIQDVNVTGFAMACFGWIGTLLGAFWNIESMQIISFLFAAFAGFGTGLYYISKSLIEWIKMLKYRELPVEEKRRSDDDEEEDQEEEKPNL
jgi:hypothetical protein